MSGRSLRRLPVLAQARHMGMLAILPPRPSPSRAGLPAGGMAKHAKQGSAATDVEMWLEAMERVVDAQALERERLAH